MRSGDTLLYPHLVFYSLNSIYKPEEVGTARSKMIKKKRMMMMMMTIMMIVITAQR
jgi:hypothetical protein